MGDRRSQRSRRITRHRRGKGFPVIEISTIQEVDDGRGRKVLGKDVAGIFEMTMDHG